MTTDDDTPTTPPGASRRAILWAVWRVVAEKGIAGVSVRSVAAAAGVSAGRVQHHFPTKTALLRASVAEMLASAEEAHLGAVRGRDARTELWLLLAHAIPRAAESRAGTSVFYSFVAAGVADPEIARMLAEAKSGVESEAAAVLTRLGSPAGRARADARHLLAVADGLVLRVLIGDLTADDAEACLRRAVDAALEGPEPPGA